MGNRRVTGTHCPECESAEAHTVLDGRMPADGAFYKRRRQCSACGARFNTYEVHETVYKRVMQRERLRAQVRQLLTQL